MTPQKDCLRLNGRVERGHRTHAEEFYECSDAEPTVHPLHTGGCVTEVPDEYKTLTAQFAARILPLPADV